MYNYNYDYSANTSMPTSYYIIALAFSVLIIVSLWKIFTKAGKPRWAAIVPIYNVIVLVQITGLPLWYIILLLIPIVNIYGAPFYLFHKCPFPK